MSLHSGIDGFGLNGHYDDNGSWQRTKFCFVSCGARCDCGPPGGLYYSAAHDKRIQQSKEGAATQSGKEVKGE